MNRLFKRSVELVVSRVVKDTFFTTTESLTVTALRVAFSIEKTLESTPNRCTVQVWNLSADSRAELQRDRIQVSLRAGYGGQLAQLFVGDLTASRTRVEGADMITELTLGDGRRAHRHARVTKSFKAGASALEVLKETAQSMGLAMPNSADSARELQTKYASGVVVSGLSSAEMSRILRAQGMTWSVQDGQLQVLPVNGAETVEAILVSTDTGMVGVPQYGVPEDDGKPPVLTISKLIDPGALPAPGRLILVDAREVSGLHVVRKVVHTGDTGGAAWQSDMEAVAA